MAKLYLKFEERVIREVLLLHGVVTIGREPDNLLQIDNPAVSGHHAKLYWEGDHYALEDTGSFNGTFVDNCRVSKIVLKDGDTVLIGKHEIEFRDHADNNAPVQHRTVDRSITGQARLDQARPQQLDQTVVLDTRKAQEMLAQAAAAASGASAIGVQTIRVGKDGSPVHAVSPARQTMGTLTVVDGKTDRRYYVLTSKLTVIGKSKMASIRLKRWFAPRVAASIHKREDGYFVAASGRHVKVKVNDEAVASGHWELKAGDVIEIAGITAVFGYEG